MCDVKCPYCDEKQNINNDGHTFENDEECVQSCSSCNKQFKFVTTVIYNYEVFCTDEHDMRQTIILEHNDLWFCSKCDFYEVLKSETSR